VTYTDAEVLALIATLERPCWSCANTGIGPAFPDA